MTQAVGNFPQQVNPPHAPVQVTVASSAANVQTLSSESTPYPNFSGIQVKNLSTNTNSVFWGISASVTTSNGDEIPAGTAQMIPASLCKDDSQLYLVASGNTTVCIVYIGG